MSQHRQALIRPSFFSLSRLLSQLQSCVQTLRPHIRYIRLPRRPQCPAYAYWGMNAYEVHLIAFISGAVFFNMLALSNFSGKQSTLAQRAWIVVWLFAAFLFVATLHPMKYAIIRANSKRDDLLSVLLRIALSVFILSYGAPAIGGFVVVPQMLKAYGICYKFI